MLLEEIEDLRQAGVLVHRHHTVRKNPYPELRNGIIEKTPLLPKRRDQKLHSKRPACTIVRKESGTKRSSVRRKTYVRREKMQYENAV